MRKIYKFVLGGFLCLPGLLLFSGRADGQVQTARNIPTGPNSNGFYEYLPAGYSTSPTKFPLMVFLHGVGELGNGGSDLPKVLDNGPPQLISQGQFPASFTVNGQTFSFIVISPQFVAWPTDQDVDNVIKYAVANYRVDTGRIYLTGLSMGGSAVWSYAPEPGHASMLAAIVPIAGGTMYSGTAGAEILQQASLPVYAAANLNDPTVASGETVADIQVINSVTPAINPPALDTIYNASGHGGWVQTYDPHSNLYKGLNIYQWMLQYTRDASAPTAPIAPLPVTLTSFTAQAIAGGAQVDIAWSTSAEQDNRYFIVQRSTDGHVFSNIDTVAAATNAATGASYSAVDAQPSPGHDYYRLAQVDLDGKLTYSNIDEVTISQGSEGLHLSPNPAESSVYLDLRNGFSGACEARIVDLSGRVMGSWRFQKQAGAYTQSVDVSHLAAGSYFIQVLGDGFRETQAFIRK
ncbi:MAG TPA: T9SS type A sorting domain-containing protein [Puia sp.]|jgi:hypothetical protein|nr:T9SS type A sorting domain-containing protein [Puia sp.]